MQLLAEVIRVTRIHAGTGDIGMRDQHLMQCGGTAFLKTGDDDGGQFSDGNVRRSVKFMLPAAGIQPELDDVARRAIVSRHSPERRALTPGEFVTVAFPADRPRRDLGIHFVSQGMNSFSTPGRSVSFLGSESPLASRIKA